jgi:5-methylcytosine-specific restriction enzyme A
MGQRFDRKKAKRERGKGKIDNVLTADASLSREKQKARELRNTSWWRRICSEGKCHYCGGKFHPEDLTMDHLIPLSRGGRSERFNIVPACKECNNKKKHLLPAEWDEYLERIQSIH